MKRAALAVLLVVALIVVVGCGGSEGYEEMPTPRLLVEGAEDDYRLEPEVAEPLGHDGLPFLSELSIPIDRAMGYFAAMEAIFDEDGGALWGAHLGVPFMFIDFDTNHAVANRPIRSDDFFGHDGVYIGRVADDLRFRMFGSVATIDGRRWATMRWDQAEAAESEEEILQRMIGEVFYMRQPELLGAEGGPMQNPYMNELFARVSVQMEINALMEALESGGGDAMLDAIRDALSIREERRNRMPGSARVENLGEVGIGTRRYTGLALVLGEKDLMIERLEWFIEANVSGGRTNLDLASAQIIGVLYALLLDEVGADWKEGLRLGGGGSTDLGAVLKTAAGIVVLPSFGSIDLERYRYTRITEIENVWLENNARIVQEAYETFSGVPVLMVRVAGNRNISGDFEVVSVPELQRGRGWEAAVAYGSFEYYGSFGRIVFNHGHLWLGFADDRISAVNMETFGNVIVGDNWVMELNEGYVIEEREGNFRVVGP
ncbi:MAG: hypothetical protein FWC93_01530 [Defluviitaleaceae bacterium]|nr:hypothetical protein [Defluviitaleaceae bacterium]